MTAHAAPARAGDEPLDDVAPVGRLGPFFAAVWLFFLLDPLLQAWQQRDTAAGLIGLVAVVAFSTLYMWLWVRMRADRARLMTRRPPLPFALTVMAGLVALGAICILTLGETGLACTVYVAVSAVMLFPFAVAAPIALVIAVGSAVVGPLAGWGSEIGLAFSVMAASVAVFGLRAVMSRNLDLVSAHRQNASLAVENERTRFARDLHDILGHSLTVITVKAELAQRLMDVDVDRARAEIADLERLSRDALVDVRRAVEGYRELTLPGELVRARTALSAAEIRADVPNSTEQVPSDLREVFAWTVREGVTNVIRHSQASRCEVVLSPTSAEVRDDGDGGCANATGDGHGLAGLRERAAAAGATVVVRHLSPGFSLSVVRGDAPDVAGIDTAVGSAAGTAVGAVTGG